jgi:hypothetical protein
MLLVVVLRQTQANAAILEDYANTTYGHGLPGPVTSRQPAPRVCCGLIVPILTASHVDPTFGSSGIAIDARIISTTKMTGAPSKLLIV